MRLILHQALKDVRLLRWFVLAWVAVLAALHGVFVYVMVAWPVEHDLLKPLETAENLLTVAATAAFIVLAALLVQNDSPATTTAFWLTRPVSRRTMLATKLVTTVVVLLIVPAIADTFDLVATGTPLGWLPFARMAVVVAWLLSLMAIAAVTVGFPQLLTVAIIELLLVAVLSLGVAPLYGDRQVGFGVGLSAVSAIGVVILAWQYLARQTRWGASMLGVAPIVIVSAMVLWSRVPAQANALVQNPIDRISVEADRVGVQVTDRVLTRYFDIPLTVHNLPDGASVSVSLTRAWLQAGDTKIDLGGVANQSPWTITPEEADQEGRRVLGRALAGGHLLDPARVLARRRHVTVFTTTSALQSIAGQRPVLHLELRVGAVGYETAATAPARPGATFVLPDAIGRVLDVRADRNEGVVSFRQTESAWPENSPPFSGQYTYLLRNARLKQALLTNGGYDGQFGPVGYRTLGSFLPVSPPLRAFWASLGVRADGLPLAAPPPEWVRDAEIVVLRRSLLGGRARTIDVTDVPLGPG